MKKFYPGKKTRDVLVLGTVFLTVLTASLILAGADLMAPHPVTAAIKCSPVITQANLSVFGKLTKKLTSDYLISQAKSYALSRVKLEYLQGPFGEMLTSGLMNPMDITGKIEGIMNAGLNSGLSVIRDQMSPEALMKSINSSTSQSLETALKGLSDMPKRLVEQTVGNYNRQFLESSGFNSYKTAARQYQQQMSNFMSTATDTSKRFMDFGQNLDIAQFVENGASSGLGSITNTKAITSELNNFVANGIQNAKFIWGNDIGVQVETGFVNLNEAYLRRQLESLRQAKGVTSLTDEKINEIISATNSKSLAAVSSYLNDTADRLTSQANKTTAAAQNAVGSTIGKVELTLQQAMNSEKQSDAVAFAVSENVRKSVRSALEAGEWRSVAAEPKPLPLPFARTVRSALDTQNAEDTKKLAVFLAGEGKKHSDVVRVNVKYFLVAKESGDVARNILQKIRTYNVSAIDKSTDDAAWKDAARFQYYTLMLQNQQMKLVAAKAMAIGIGTSLKALDKDLAGFIDKTGLPANF